MSTSTRAGISLGLMVGFYLLAVGIGAGLLWIAWIAISAGSAAGIKVALASGIGGGSLLLSLRPRRDEFVQPGPRLEHYTQPQLFEVLNDVARATGQAMPNAVFLSPDVNAAVMTRGGVLGIGGHRVMILGLPLMHVLTVDQLKAVLAHEFGHYGGGDTRVGRLVYHTRASLGRTLSAVEGRWMEWVFAQYAAFVMRVSAAVAREQEFAADQFAARATSRHDMVHSLRRIDHVAGHFPAFFGHNVMPTFEAGFRPPIGSGFASYCEFISMQPAAPTVDTRPDADRRYDSHPSTASRIAALEAVDADAPRIGDERPASALLGHVAELEVELYAHDPGRGRGLKPIDWAGVTEKVMLPRWKGLVWKQRNALKNVSIESLPTNPAAVVAAGRSSSDPRIKAMDDANVLYQTLNAISAAVMLRLIDAGWTPAGAPSDGSTLLRGTESVQPVRRVYEIAFGQTPIDDWAAFCRSAGVTGPLASAD